MASIIKNRLKELCEKDKSLETLWAQWTMDELLITKALNNISQTFPHYSLHDASHSNQIVTNIERIIGAENINLLSATDLWMILESAFCHDIGMVVPMKKIREDWDKPEFKSFLSSIVNDTSHEFNLIAKKYQDNCEEDFFANSHWPLDVLEEVRLLLAEFYRRNHATNANTVVRNPFDEIGLNSPRNELLPKRLFKILGAVSAHHGYSFEDVMLLPKKEVGLGNDEAHPRYIACLLRLGDLLDLDDNRFCPVMLNTAGNVPLSTHAHIEKHLSIEHFRMDQNRIEVVAVCESYDGYAATSSWFEYLEDEIKQQMMNWDNIVPDKKMGLLPTIGKLDIQLKGYELLNRDRTPRFEVDADKMFNLIQGSGLYKNSGQCIREILQNAADTTLLKLWCDKTILNKHKDICFKEPSDQINSILEKDYSIDVNINEISSNEDTVVWEISIKDSGMGIDKKGLSFLQNIGSSNKDLIKKALIKSMPYWLKPSGAFGIGFQSIFMITEQVIIQSKSFYGNEVLIVEMNDPNKSKSGSIFIKKENNGYKYESGTLLKFRIEKPKIVSAFTYSLNDKGVVAEINGYDFIEDKQLNVEIVQLISEVLKFAQHSYIPIKLNFQGAKINLEQSGFNGDGFFHDSGFRIQLYNFENDRTFTNGRYNSNLLFKGQELETGFPTDFCRFEIDLLGFDADEYLEINRNKIKTSKQEQLFQKIAHALNDYFLTSTENWSKEEKHFIDAFLITNKSVADFVNESNSQNTMPDIHVGQSAYRAGEILGTQIITFNIIKHNNLSEFNKREPLSIGIHENKCEITTDYHHSDTSVQLLENYLIPKHFNGIKIYVNAEKEKKLVQIEYTKDGMCVIDDSAFKALLMNTSNRWPRAVFLCPDEYQALAVKTDNIRFCEWLHHQLHHPVNITNKALMIMPFKTGDKSFSKYHFDQLVEWVFENRTNSNTTKSEISDTYDKFIAYIKSIF